MIFLLASHPPPVAAAAAWYSFHSRAIIISGLWKTICAIAREKRKKNSPRGLIWKEKDLNSFFLLLLLPLWLYHHQLTETSLVQREKASQPGWLVSQAKWKGRAAGKRQDTSLKFRTRSPLVNLLAILVWPDHCRWFPSALTANHRHCSTRGLLTENKKQELSFTTLSLRLLYTRG